MPLLDLISVHYVESEVHEAASLLASLSDTILSSPVKLVMLPTPATDSAITSTAGTSATTANIVSSTDGDEVCRSDVSGCWDIYDYRLVKSLAVLDQSSR